MTDNVEQSLSEFLLEDGTPEGFAAETFVVNDEDQALWAMRKLAGAQRQIVASSHRAEAEHKRIDAWYEQVTKAPESTKEYFSGLLTAYAIRQRENGVKSLSYPDGYVKTRSAGGNIAIRDDAAFVAWAQSTGHNELLRIKAEPSLADIKKSALFDGDSVVIDGEVVESLRITPSEVSVSFTVSE